MGELSGTFIVVEWRGEGEDCTVETAGEVEEDSSLGTAGRVEKSCYVLLKNCGVIGF